MANPPNYGVVWLAIGSLLIIVAVAVFVVGSVTAPRPALAGGSALNADAPMCRPRSSWPERGTVFIRQSAAIPAAEIRTTVTVRAGGPEGQSVTLMPFDGIKATLPGHGFYFSVATVDLREVDPATEVCIDATGLAGRISGDDLLIAPPIPRGAGTRPAWVMPTSITIGLLAVASLARFAMIFAANKP